MIKNIIRNGVLATALALSVGSGVSTTASAHGFGFGGFGGWHGGHYGWWGNGYHWGGYYGPRWGFPRYGWGWGYGYPVSYSPCWAGYHRNPWGTCVPTYYRPF